MKVQEMMVTNQLEAMIDITEQFHITKSRQEKNNVQGLYNIITDSLKNASDEDIRLKKSYTTIKDLLMRSVNETEKSDYFLNMAKDQYSILSGDKIYKPQTVSTSL